VTNRQRLALEHPCLIEKQCAADGYRRLHFPWSMILTLNVGLDDAPIFDGLLVWHWLYRAARSERSSPYS
jgi:hypothetical protein